MYLDGANYRLLHHVNINWTGRAWGKKMKLLIRLVQFMNSFVFAVALILLNIFQEWQRFLRDLSNISLIK